MTQEQQKQLRGIIPEFANLAKKMITNSPDIEKIINNQKYGKSN